MSRFAGLIPSRISQACNFKFYPGQRRNVGGLFRTFFNPVLIYNFEKNIPVFFDFLFADTIDGRQRLFRQRHESGHFIQGAIVKYREGRQIGFIGKFFALFSQQFETEFVMR